MFSARSHDARRPIADQTPALRQMLDPYIRPGMNLTLIRITMRIGMPCAIVAVSAVGLFIVVRHFAWMG
jgi:hypothetical protein